MLLRLALTIALIGTSCAPAQLASQQRETRPTPTATPSSEPTPSSSSVSLIHKIDFDNFTYPAAPVYQKSEKPFTLKDGKYAGRLQKHGGAEPEAVSLVDTIYGDVTGDGVADAIIVLTENIRGSAIPYFVYVYRVESNKPKLLWSFATGDRAQGGLRRVFAETGHLVVELYGKNEYVGMADFDAGSECAACVAFYTRSRYERRGDRYQRLERLEVVPANGSASYLSSDEKP
jgi:hypothetical protein